MAKGAKTGGRKAGTPNKRTTDLLEVIGNYNPLEALINIAGDKNTPLDAKIKINLDLLPYIYPKRKAIELNDISENKRSIEETQKELIAYFNGDGEEKITEIINKAKAGK